MASHHNHHIQSYGKLAAVLGALLFLTLVTVLGATFIDLGVLNVPAALAIASSKVTLVLMFFMHLKYESKVITISFISTVIFLAIMISFTFWDVAFR